MPLTHEIPNAAFPATAGNKFLHDVAEHDDSLIYFLCNVGDGDTQVLLLPRNPTVGHRQAMIVDASSSRKAQHILDWATARGLLAPPVPAGGTPTRDIALAVATHPHRDHIRGMSNILHTNADRIMEFWDPGYFHTTGDYHNMMRRIADNEAIIYSQPTSGYRRWFGHVMVTVLSPSIHLRNRFDTYGIGINDSSLSLQIEFPTPRARRRDEHGNHMAPGQSPAVLVLGGDAQTLSWSYVLTDFPRLRRSRSAAASAIGAAQGSRDLLRAGVHKVSHHASKNGVNLELAARINASYTLVSSVRDGGSHGFPHGITQHVLREARSPKASSGEAHQPEDDPNLGLFYTGDAIDGGVPLGTIALIIRGRSARMWRFGDTPSAALDLDGPAFRAAESVRL